jgi:hypothetical protein
MIGCYCWRHYRTSKGMRRRFSTLLRRPFLVSLPQIFFPTQQLVDSDTERLYQTATVIRQYPSHCRAKSLDTFEDLVAAQMLKASSFQRLYSGMAGILTIFASADREKHARRRTKIIWLVNRQRRSDQEVLSLIMFRSRLVWAIRTCVAPRHPFAPRK